jgi:hypothetical protein
MGRRRAAPGFSAVEMMELAVPCRGPASAKAGACPRKESVPSVGSSSSGVYPERSRRVSSTGTSAGSLPDQKLTVVAYAECCRPKVLRNG